jgi:hypothetical protein
MNLESLHTTKAVAINQINLLLVFLKCASFLDAVNKHQTNITLSIDNFSEGFFYWGVKAKPV